MTKKHFEAIARIINDVRDENFRGEAATEEIANRLGEFFKSENPRFDLDRFLTACGF